MRVNCVRFLPILAVFGFVAATFQTAFADSAPPSNNPQIVRLSYVEGDVRVTRGAVADKQDAKQNGTSTGWEQAVKNLPIESGYSIVTGTGRVEIEFEDASTLYLADNSVLVFTLLRSVNGVPYSDLALLSGRATANVHTTVPGERFRVTTPTDTLTTSYPRKAVWRIDSYLDAVSVTPQFDPSVPIEQVVPAQVKGIGVTSSYSHGTSVLRAAKVDAAAGVAWDAWVAGRLSARAEAVAATMKEAGLKTPIPGLAEMKGQGHFFSCEPYGTCWEPTNGWDGKGNSTAEAASAQIATSGQVVPAVSGAAAKGGKGYKPTKTQTYLAAHPGATLYTEDYFFPCSAYPEQDIVAIDPVTGKRKIIDSYFNLALFSNTAMYPMQAPFAGMRNGMFLPVYGWGPDWDWAICHSGSWIRWNHHYAWVAGSNRHYECVTWVKDGHSVGWVPIHPHDGIGKQPGNLKDGLMKYQGKGPQPYTRIGLEEGKQVKQLGEPPKDLRRPEMMHLANAETPHPHAHSAFEAVVAAKGQSSASDVPRARGTVSSAPIAGQNAERTNPEQSAVEQRSTEVRSSQTRRSEASAAGSPIVFDRKSQVFSVERQVNESGRNVTVMQPIGRAGAPDRGSNSGYGNRGNSSQSYNQGNSSQPYNPSIGSNSNSNSTPSYTPSPSYNAPSNTGYSNAGSYSAPSAPSYSPPAPSYSPPAPSYSPPASTPTPVGPVGR